jgi:hypothetical protein
MKLTLSKRTAQQVRQKPAIPAARHILQARHLGQGNPYAKSAGSSHGLLRQTQFQMGEIPRCISAPAFESEGLKWRTERDQILSIRITYHTERLLDIGSARPGTKVDRLRLNVFPTTSFISCRLYHIGSIAQKLVTDAFHNQEKARRCRCKWPND